MDLQLFAEGAPGPDKPEGSPLVKAIEELTNLVQGLVEKLEAHIQSEEDSVEVPDVPPPAPQPAQDDVQPEEGQPAEPAQAPSVRRPRWL